MKELIFEDHLVPGYYININGEMFSSRKPGINRFNSHDRDTVCYGGKLRKLPGTKYGKYTVYRLSKKFTHKEDSVIRQFGVLAHRAVMETFNPFENNLPEDLCDEWKNLSQIVKRYIIDGWTIDHKENLNENFNHLANLQWLSKRHNASKGNGNRRTRY